MTMTLRIQRFPTRTREHQRHTHRRILCSYDARVTSREDFLVLSVKPGLRQDYADFIAEMTKAHWAKWIAEREGWKP